MKIYLINLDRNPDRLATADSQLRELNFSYERMRAVDGRSMSKRERSKHVSAVHSRMARLEKLTPGEVGCALSHLAVYRKMLSENIPVALVLEDDVKLARNFPAALHCVERVLDSGRSQVYVFKDKILTELENCPQYTVKAIRSMLWTDAYVITLPAAQALLRANYPVVTVADWWGRWRARGLIELYLISPPSTTQRQSEFVSEVTPNPVPQTCGMRLVLRKLVRLPCICVDWVWWFLFRK